LVYARHPQMLKPFLVDVSDTPLLAESQPALEWGPEEEKWIKPGGDIPSLIVSPGDDGQFDRIQDAIDYAEPGFRIVVRPGQYNQSIVVNKKLEIIGDGARDRIVLCSGVNASLRVEESACL